VVLFIVGFLLDNSFPAVEGIFLNGLNWFSQAGLNGVVGSGRLVVLYTESTVYLATGGTALAVAVGVPCAIYMAEFADMRFRNFTKTSMEVLDGFPSIVIGLLGFALFVNPISRYSFSGFLHTQAGQIFEGCDLYGWLILLIMSFPIVATITEDALRAVPQELREASLGIGATKWQTTKEVLLPSAMPRILTAILLALAAAMGEMVALYFVLNGSISSSLLTSPLAIFNPLARTSTLSIIMETSYNASLDGAGPPGPGVYFLGFLLFAIVGIINVAVRVILAKRTTTQE